VNKHLIILNQSKESLLSKDYENILEVFIDTPMTLGMLRNISLQFVPLNAVWTTWDDDDWRHETFLKTMMTYFIKDERLEFLMFQNRLECNIRSMFMFESTMKSGTMIFFAKQNPNLIYDDVNVLEDRIIQTYALENMKYVIVKNDPKLYLRIIHTHNTSIYVDPNKTNTKNNDKAINYFEHEISNVNKQYVKNIISTQYKNVLSV
jgi:hypothetical protein